MFGNLINNRQLKGLLETKEIEIYPFIAENLSTAHYTLRVGKVLKRLDDGTFKTMHDFNENTNPFTIKENEYIIVEVYETIKLNNENIIGHFVPASNLIKDGISLIAGKIDKKYGNTGPSKGFKPEMIQFGLKNNLNESFQLPSKYRVAHLELFDLRGVSSEKVELTNEEKLIIAKRFIRAFDDGVNHDSESD